ncbi:Peptidyl-tRNA hydrolase, archaeal type [Vibrio chagasii]|nr:Peptidyl-tRNA hydrolase, archaeal type [Vibrio chagasii]
MPAGKLSAQAGHAYEQSMVSAMRSFPNLANSYIDNAGGSKVSLFAKNSNALVKAYNQAMSLGVPCSIVVDQGHILPPFFNGEPIITALGIGPIAKSQVASITKRFNCIK